MRDKNLATYLGRPPLIDSYFCDLELPLDLDDDDIIHPENMRDSVLNRLDRDGWNTNVIPGKSLRSVTGIRLRLQMAILREKILRLSLGNRVADNKALLSYVASSTPSSLFLCIDSYVYSLISATVIYLTTIERLGRLFPHSTVMKMTAGNAWIHIPAWYI